VELTAILERQSGDLIKEIETPATYNITTVQNNIWVGDAGKIIVYDGSVRSSHFIITIIIITITIITMHIMIMHIIASRSG
jgi:hypothetical protein